MRPFFSRRFRIGRYPASALFIACWLLVSTRVHAYTIYVSSEKDNSITVVDGETYKVLKTVAVGERPRGIALSKDNKLLYVCTSDADHIEVLDLETLKVTHTLPSGPDPELLVLGPEGRLLYVANEDDNMVTVIDTEQLIWPTSST
jgi:YVTN family beta-propeller protein